MLFTYVAAAASMFRCVERLWSEKFTQRIDGPSEISSLLQTGSARPTHSHNVSPGMSGTALRNLKDPRSTLHSLFCRILVSLPLQLLSAGGVRHKPQQGERQQR